MDRCPPYPVLDSIDSAKLCSENVFITETQFVVHLSQRMYTLQMHLCRYSDVLMNCVPKAGFHLSIHRCTSEKQCSAVMKQPFAGL